jgi:hypothetical protein
MGDSFKLDAQEKSDPSKPKPKPKAKRSDIKTELLEALTLSRDGLTTDEATQLVSAGAATVRRALASMHEAGLVFCEGKRKGRSKRALPVYRARKSETGATDLDVFGRSVSGMRDAKERDRNPRVYQCPACGQDFVWQHIDDCCSPAMCDTQRRIVVFDGPYDEHGCPEDPISGYEEGSGRLVLGRPANEEERKHYRKHGNLDGVIPWTIARGTHLMMCTRWDRWLSGEVSWKKEAEKEQQPRSFKDKYKRG